MAAAQRYMEARIAVVLLAPEFLTTMDLRSQERMTDDQLMNSQAPSRLSKGALACHRAGLMVNTVDTGISYYDASGPCRDAAIRGKLHSGRCPDDPRSRNRKCY